MIVVSSSKEFVGVGCITEQDDPHILVKLAQNSYSKFTPFPLYTILDNNGTPTQEYLGSYEIINDELDDEEAIFGGFLKNIVLKRKSE
jgi:hypothetical protein